jgi:hypothetical protein
LCHLNDFDVYTLLHSRNKTPTKFCFAVRAQQASAFYESMDDYAKFLCVDHMDKMKDWVMSIRSAKV